MVDCATHAGRVLLDGAQPRGGFAGVEDLRLGAVDRLHVFRGHGRDPAEMLEEVEADTLRGHHAARRSEEPRNDLIRLHLLAVLGLGVELDALVDTLEHALRDAEAGDHAVLLANDLAATGHIHGNDGLGGDIASSDVLGERRLDEQVDALRRKRLGDGSKGDRQSVLLCPCA